MSFVEGGKAAAVEDADERAVSVLGREVGGFSFDLHRRNQMMLGAGAKLPRMKKTGTTIVGVVFNGGVVLGADTRATEGTVIADKNCQKIHYIAPNVYCCGAGTAADTENVTELIAGKLELLRRATDCQSRVVTAMTMLKRHLFQYQGHVSAALVLGGIDVTGPHLYTVYPHGSTDKLPFVTMGSGSLAAMSVFESGYKDDMTEDEARDLVRDAIRAGVYNDLGSGGNVDVMIIRESGTEMLRGYERENEGSEVRARHTRPEARLRITKGATVFLSEEFTPHTAAPAAADDGDSKMDD